MTGVQTCALPILLSSLSAEFIVCGDWKGNMWFNQVHSTARWGPRRPVSVPQTAIKGVVCPKYYIYTVSHPAAAFSDVMLTRKTRLLAPFWRFMTDNNDLWPLKAHSDRISVLRLTDSTIISASHDSTVKLWDRNTSKYPLSNWTSWCLLSPNNY